MPFPISSTPPLAADRNPARLVRENQLNVRSLVYPLFVCPGSKVKDEIKSMPGNYRWSVDLLVEECKSAHDLGIPAVILFGIPESKDEVGSGAYDPDGIVQRAVRAIKKELRDLLVICDVCLDEYTSHGHCGLIQERGSGQRFDAAAAGQDRRDPGRGRGRHRGALRYDGRPRGAHSPGIGRSRLYPDAHSGLLRQVRFGILRTLPEAADSAPKFGDRKSYQMDPANQREAMREIARLRAGRISTCDPGRNAGTPISTLQAAFDFAEHHALDRSLRLERLVEFAPDFELLGLGVRKHHRTVFGLGAFEVHVNLVAFLDRRMSLHGQGIRRGGPALRTCS